MKGVNMVCPQCKEKVCAKIRALIGALSISNGGKIAPMYFSAKRAAKTWMLLW